MEGWKGWEGGRSWAAKIRKARFKVPVASSAAKGSLSQSSRLGGRVCLATGGKLVPTFDWDAQKAWRGGVCACRSFANAQQKNCVRLNNPGAASDAPPARRQTATKLAQAMLEDSLWTASPPGHTFHPPNLPSFHPSILPPFHPSTLPSFHPSILPSFHPSILPSVSPPFHSLSLILPRHAPLSLQRNAS